MCGGTVSDLPGLGPKSREILARAGIATAEELRRVGTVAAYVRAKRVSPNVSINLLWGLEAAITGIPWQEVARRERTRLLMAVEDYERSEPRFRS